MEVDGIVDRYAIGVGRRRDLLPRTGCHRGNDRCHEVVERREISAIFKAMTTSCHLPTVLAWMDGSQPRS